MKKPIFSLTLVPLILAFAGCGQKEEPAVETAQVESAEAAEVAEAAAVDSEPGQTENSLLAATDALKKAVPDLKKQMESTDAEEDVSKAMDEEVARAMEEAVPDVEEVVVAQTQVTAIPEEDEVHVTKEVAVMEVEAPEVEAMEVPEVPEVEAEEDTLMSKAVGAAGIMASQLDLSNLSWDTVSEIPYNDKTQLLAWATQQASTWKSKLTDAAMDQGTSMLNNLGDSGWQGALKKVMDALDGVREASPETWQTARGALVSAWENFETQATAFLSKE